MDVDAKAREVLSARQLVVSDRAFGIRASTDSTCADVRGRVCPLCRSTLRVRAFALSCLACDRNFPRIAGLADLRIAPDRYLSLDADRAKAEHLAAVSESSDFAGLVSAYYAMTEDVNAQRRRRFLAHIRRAVSRAEALAAGLPEDGRVLEIGCGTGGLLCAASRRGLQIDGLDIASRWLVLARQRLIQTLLRSSFVPDLLTAGNADALPWPDGTFTCVVADSVVEHLDDAGAAFREWRRVTRPGGRLVLWSPNRYSVLTDPHVGLWGIGWLPRSIQSHYVRARRRCDWPLRLISASEAASGLRDAGWTVRSVTAASAPTDLAPPAVRSSYERLRSWPITRSLLRMFGPLWQIVATREDSP